MANVIFGDDGSGNVAPPTFDPDWIAFSIWFAGKHGDPAKLQPPLTQQNYKTYIPAYGDRTTTYWDEYVNAPSAGVSSKPTADPGAGNEWILENNVWVAKKIVVAGATTVVSSILVTTQSGNQIYKITYSDGSIKYWTTSDPTKDGVEYDIITDPLAPGSTSTTKYKLDPTTGLPVTITIGGYTYWVKEDGQPDFTTGVSSTDPNALTDYQKAMIEQQKQANAIQWNQTLAQLKANPSDWINAYMFEHGLTPESKSLITAAGSAWSTPTTTTTPPITTAIPPITTAISNTNQMTARPGVMKGGQSMTPQGWTPQPDMATAGVNSALTFQSAGAATGGANLQQRDILRNPLTYP